MKLRDENWDARLNEFDDFVSLKAVEKVVFREDLRQLQEERTRNGHLAQTLFEELAERRRSFLNTVRVQHEDHPVEAPVHVHEDIDDDFFDSDESQILFARCNHLVEWRDCSTDFQQILELSLAQVVRQRLAVEPVEHGDECVLWEVEKHRNGCQRGGGCEERGVEREVEERQRAAPTAEWR